MQGTVQVAREASACPWVHVHGRLGSVCMFMGACSWPVSMHHRAPESAPNRVCTGAEAVTQLIAFAAV
jgi:hypothetical protein